MAIHNDVGKLGENLAEKYLKAKGFEIFDRNYNWEKAEIDIVAFKENVIHFVEVKTRTNLSYQDPVESVTAKKQKLLGRAGISYLWERQLMSLPAVFDIITIGVKDVNNPIFRHIEDAFQPNDH